MCVTRREHTSIHRIDARISSALEGPRVLTAMGSGLTWPHPSSPTWYHPPSLSSPSITLAGKLPQWPFLGPHYIPCASLAGACFLGAAPSASSTARNLHEGCSRV